MDAMCSKYNGRLSDHSQRKRWIDIKRKRKSPLVVDSSNVSCRHAIYEGCWSHIPWIGDTCPLLAPLRWCKAKCCNLQLVLCFDVSWHLYSNGYYSLPFSLVWDDGCLSKDEFGDFSTSHSSPIIISFACLKRSYRSSAASWCGDIAMFPHWQSPWA